MRSLLLAAAIVLVGAAPAAAAPELVKLGDFLQPVHVATPPNDARVFVVEQDGLVKIVGGGTFLDVTDRTNGTGERGLLSIAFSPDYATSRLFYVFLTSQADGSLQVLEFQASAADPNVADPATARSILTIPHAGAANHNGGQLQFGPDGMLYVSTGDGGDTPAAARDLGSELGKILRIEPRSGAAAPGNPYGTRVWAYGLRNPWRFSFDRATGDLLIGDVGASTWEEVNWARAPSPGAGVDYGWNCAEGTSGGCGTPPAFARNHSAGYQAIIGGYVVRDPGLPSLAGRYLYGDSALGSLRSVVLPDTDDRAEPLAVTGLSSFGQDACGRLYAASLNGPVYRIQEGAPTPCSFATAPPPDLSPPGLRVAVRGVKRRRLVRVVVRCDEACRVRVGTRLRRIRRLPARTRSLAANQRAVVRMKMSRKVARRMRRALRRRGHVRFVVAVRAVDAAGNARVVTRRGRIRR